MNRIVCLGEAMLELSAQQDQWHLGCGGDTFNTAVHLRRAGHDVAYMTALGNDPFSERMRATWRGEGIDCDLALTHPDRIPGLYAIATDDRGERRFTYWREASAARALFEAEGIAAAEQIARQAALFYFSLISLAILPDVGRERLITLARGVREAGGRVAFDGNYRPRLWEDTQTALSWRDRALATADIGLPTYEDEAQLSGERSRLDVLREWQALGCREVIVKLGGDGCLLPDGSLVPVPEVLRPVDTSGAGDAFNGGYLAARMRGRSEADAAQAGHALAGWTVMRRGAVPAPDAAAPYASLL